MNGAGLKLIAVLLGALVLTACSSKPSKTDDANSRASVEDRSINSGAEDANGGQTQGLNDDRGLNNMSLDDPDSILAVRVIYFDYNSSNIRSDFADAVAAHAAYLAANPAASVTLEGHADERGSREYNLALGEHRALAVRRQLVLLGASASQIEAVSYGEERPASDGHSEQDYATNRRVELVY